MKIQFTTREGDQHIINLLKEDFPYDLDAMAAITAFYGIRDYSVEEISMLRETIVVIHDEKE